ncbi:MAG: hypothetical protein A4E50_00089 [Methanosaeta sp. PtaB.Bin087]|nr:MAG: hypothetical protein A4E50_00089 [Methanosaeta sp. PtaB.Bin087]
MPRAVDEVDRSPIALKVRDGRASAAVEIGEEVGEPRRRERSQDGGISDLKAVLGEALVPDREVAAEEGIAVSEDGDGDGGALCLSFNAAGGGGDGERLAHQGDDAVGGRLDEESGAPLGIGLPPEDSALLLAAQKVRDGGIGALPPFGGVYASSVESQDRPVVADGVGVGAHPCGDKAAVIALLSSDVSDRIHYRLRLWVLASGQKGDGGDPGGVQIRGPATPATAA